MHKEWPSPERSLSVKLVIDSREHEKKKELGLKSLSEHVEVKIWKSDSSVSLFVNTVSTVASNGIKLKIKCYLLISE